jgi:ketosteroid isomerase-like protein
MPWFPEFVSAVELVRLQGRVAGQADPVGQYVAALNRGDTHPLEDVWPGEVVVYDPRAGEVRGHQQLRQLVKRSRILLAERHARVETMASTVAGDRAVVELLVHLAQDGREQDGPEVAWPVAVVAECPDHRSVVFRSYFSQRTLDGQRHLRPAILGPGAAHPGDVVGRYHAALAAADTDAVVSTFAPDGYFREPISRHTHRGTDELRAFFGGYLRAGAPGLEHCAVTDDGVRCALEYNCVRWGGRDLPPQAGIAVYERGTDGLLTAARVYDDVDAPSAPGDTRE